MSELKVNKTYAEINARIKVLDNKNKKEIKTKYELEGYEKYYINTNNYGNYMKKITGITDFKGKYVTADDSNVYMRIDFGGFYKWYNRQ